MLTALWAQMSRAMPSRGEVMRSTTSPKRLQISAIGCSAWIVSPMPILSRSSPPRCALTVNWSLGKRCDAAASGVAGKHPQMAHHVADPAQVDLDVALVQRAVAAGLGQDRDDAAASRLIRHRARRRRQRRILLGRAPRSAGCRAWPAFRPAYRAQHRPSWQSRSRATGSRPGHRRGSRCGTGRRRSPH